MFTTHELNEITYYLSLYELIVYLNLLLDFILFNRSPSAGMYIQQAAPGGVLQCPGLQGSGIILLHTTWFNLLSIRIHTDTDS